MVLALLLESLRFASVYSAKSRSVQLMSHVNLTLRTVVCRGYGEDSPEATINNSNTSTPLSSGWSFDGPCASSLSEHTTTVSFFDDEIERNDLALRCLQTVTFF